MLTLAIIYRSFFFEQNVRNRGNILNGHQNRRRISDSNFSLQLYYTAGQLLRTDNTIIYSNHKMKGSKMWKIIISAGYSKKKHA